MGGAPAVSLEVVGQGFDSPLIAVGQPDVPDRLYVVEQDGRVKILEPGNTQAPTENFLQVMPAGPSSPNDERGLLGFALHPDYPTDPRVYVNYTTGNPLRTRIEEFTVDPANPDQVDPGSARTILELHQPAGNHNGGMIAFGPDGYLYIGMGDGGGSNDSAGDASRDPQVLLAKILRIDVDGTDSHSPEACESCQNLGSFEYGIPADNPFVGDPNFADEIWAWGLRNPWRFAFDLETGGLYAGDVGQNQIEEIDFIEGGKDYGWVDMEGFSCNGSFASQPCDDSAGANEENMHGMVAPLIDYRHQNGRCSVTGGAVYRACEVPGWSGIYFYTDFCSGEVWALLWDGSTVDDIGFVASIDGQFVGNGWNAWGDVYLTGRENDGFETDGRVYRIAPG